MTGQDRPEPTIHAAFLGCANYGGLNASQDAHRHIFFVIFVAVLGLIGSPRARHARKRTLKHITEAVKAATDVSAQVIAKLRPTYTTIQNKLGH